MAHLDIDHQEFDLNSIQKLAQGTLAYYLGDLEQKEQIEKLFTLLAQNITRNIPDPEKRVLFGKSLFGIHDSTKISNWLTENTDTLLTCDSETELLDVVWVIMTSMIEKKQFVKCSKPEVLLKIAKGWIEGKSFEELYSVLQNSHAQISAEKRPSNYQLEDLIDICENAIAFEGALVLGAIIDFLDLISGDDVAILIDKLQTLLKKLKYGLASPLAIILYECGFADRVVSTELGAIFKDLDPVRETIVDALQHRQENVFQVLNKYPSYFSEVYQNLT